MAAKRQGGLNAWEKAGIGAVAVGAVLTGAVGIEREPAQPPKWTEGALDVTAFRAQTAVRNLHAATVNRLAGLTGQAAPDPTQLNDSSEVESAYRRYGRLGQSLVNLDKDLRQVETALAGADPRFTPARRGQALPDDVNRLTPADVGDYLRAARSGVEHMGQSADRLSRAHSGTPDAAAAEVSADGLRRVAADFPSEKEIGAAQRDADQRGATNAAGAPLTRGRLTAAREGRRASARRAPAPQPAARPRRTL
ncbi:hypothetical protein LG943_06445 [Streptomonospora sp. S1-112]|uniref:Uncharacterized protein n=1 Tax=Streptomonospora mangrovi TaxID=2883123 RepID=A0A9X3SM29_9ACTN|nr:hypothetical protein [Streptomonospora mangrovi]MDA0563966.1 hypothetical protein [Streptomonospora mangrovi]